MPPPPVIRRTAEFSPSGPAIDPHPQLRVFGHVNSAMPVPALPVWRGAKRALKTGSKRGAGAQTEPAMNMRLIVGSGVAQQAAGTFRTGDDR